MRNKLKEISVFTVLYKTLYAFLSIIFYNYYILIYIYMFALKM